MKSYTKYVCSMAAGAVMGASIYFVTKGKQEKARKENRHVPYGPYEAVLKRPLDVVVSGAALIILSPVLFIIAILVRIKLGSPVIFKQERPGRIDPETGEEKIFTLYKFRTMTDKRGVDGELLPDEERLTRFGRILRESSGDETLEVYNILKGDMSLVGPRPLLVRYIPAYKETERHRHDVRPGLTGLAQINGRNFIHWDERLAYDVEYVNKITFVGDMKILAKTVLKVLRHDDVASNTDEIDEGYLDEIRGVSK